MNAGQTAARKATPRCPRKPSCAGRRASNGTFEDAWEGANSPGGREHLHRRRRQPEGSDRPRTTRRAICLCTAKRNASSGCLVRPSFPAPRCVARRGGLRPAQQELPRQRPKKACRWFVLGRVDNWMPCMDGLDRSPLLPGIEMPAGQHSAWAFSPMPSRKPVGPATNASCER
jgi:hypothetical protein